MSCCGQKREAMRQRWIVSVPPDPGPAVPAPPRTPVVFRGSGSYLVTGPQSHHVYHFSQQQPEQWIDAKDAAALLRTGLFQAKS